MDELEKRGFVVFGHSEIKDECCIWAFHDRLHTGFAFQSSTWRSQAGTPLEYAELLEYVGAAKTSLDVHLPLSLVVRPHAQEE